VLIHLRKSYRLRRPWRAREVGSCAGGLAGRWAEEGGDLFPGEVNKLLCFVSRENYGDCTLRLVLAKVVRLCEILEESSEIDSWTWVGLQAPNVRCFISNGQDARTSRMSRSRTLW